MLELLLYPLAKYFSPFNLFQYTTFRALYAAVTALLLSLVIGPALIRWLKKIKFGQTVRTDGPETHLKKSGTPTMGGIMMLFSMAVSILLWMDLTNPYTWISLVSLIGFGLIGFVDDYIKITKKDSDGLKGPFKFAAQLIVGGIVVSALMIFGSEFTTLLYLPLLKNAIADLGWLYIPLAIMLLVGFSNAVNLTDGLDGLATGLVIMSGIAFAVIAYLSGHSEVAEYLQIPFIGGGSEITVLALTLVGASVGFLWFNAHPAQVMMGDTGSLSLGGILGTMALMIKKEVLLFIIGFVFIMEVGSVIIQVISYKLRKKRVFLMAPIHHHFEMKGWAETKVVTRLWILGGLFALIGISMLKNSVGV